MEVKLTDEVDVLWKPGRYFLFLKKQNKKYKFMLNGEIIAYWKITCCKVLQLFKKCRIAMQQKKRKFNKQQI